ncbi:hypothetical protein [Kitasatospora sp. NBC_00458]|uniref:hypothetical protein n=1 Tax=Kitasatospora sp. NBC_00458 TaxID=2903568 RepID=UPI002E188ECD
MNPLPPTAEQLDHLIGHTDHRPLTPDEHALLRAGVRLLREQQAELLTELGGRDAAARERWMQNQERQLGIKWADFRAGRWEMDLAGGRDFVAAYVAAARALLGDAPNYSETRLELDVKIAESPEVYTLVVQRHAPGALTPHEARQRAEARVRQLETELAAERREREIALGRILHFAAEAHRRKWHYDNGGEDTHPAFAVLHQLGNEMNNWVRAHNPAS